MIKHYFSFGILFLSLLFSFKSFGVSDGFSQELWSSWGEGLHFYDYYTGNDENGSLYLSSNADQKATFYKKYSNMKNGEYTISFWVKGNRVQKGKWSRSFWFFTDSGTGEKSCFEDIVGTFDWSLVKCPVTISNGTLEAWFRLQSTGNIWVDDFKIESKKSIKKLYSLNYTKPSAFKYINSDKCLSKSKEKFKMIYPRGEDYSPFTYFKKTLEGKEALLKKNKFYNIDIDALSDTNWGDYDYIELVINSSNVSELQMAIEDIESKDYWSKLNFKSTLVSGENTIVFPLKRSVGERGSTKDGRKIDYQALTKIWLVIDPDNKFNNKNKISLKTISLKSSPHVQMFKDLVLFDFTQDYDSAFNCFNAVTPFHVYESSDDYGFVTKIDKVHDSIYADRLNRDVILVNDNEFKMKLKNGRYKVILNWNMLGHWDVPFWHKRSLSAQGKVIKIETRSTINEYLKDYLRFENIEPSHGDHPWDLYLSDIFKPVEFEVEVKNNFLNLSFSGDETGVALNWLAVYPLTKSNAGNNFVKDLNNQIRTDFNLIGRYAPDEVIEDQSTHVSFIKELKRIHPLKLYNNSNKKIKLSATLGMKNLLNFVVYSNDEDNLKLNILSKYSSCFSHEWKRGQYQFISQDRNHETYLIATKQLRPISSENIIETNRNNQIVLDLSINDNCTQQDIPLDIVFTLGMKEYKFPVSIKVYQEKLQRLDFPVGFLGFNPLTFKYYITEYNRKEASESISSWSSKYLNKIIDDGLTTFSTMKSIDSDIFDSIMKKAKSSTHIEAVFTYGGDKDFTEFLLQSTPKDIKLLKSKLSKWPRLIHTFSDEAGGYSDRLDQDIEIGSKLKKKAPFLNLGGFSSMDKSHRKINKLFDEGSYSNYKKFEVTSIKKWGIYNPASLPLDNPHFSFGTALYILRNRGLSHLLGWHLSAAQNYPYYDLDGRENDAMMLYPTSSGDLVTTIKYEQALQGITDFKLLLLLERKAKSSGARGLPALSWLKNILNTNIFDKTNGYLNHHPNKNLSNSKIREKAFYFINNL